MENNNRVHTHRDEQDNPAPCSITKAECDAWHQAQFERMSAILEIGNGDGV